MKALKGGKTKGFENQIKMEITLKENKLKEGALCVG